MSPLEVQKRSQQCQLRFVKSTIKRQYYLISQYKLIWIHVHEHFSSNWFKIQIIWLLQSTFILHIHSFQWFQQLQFYLILFFILLGNFREMCEIKLILKWNNWELHRFSWATKEQNLSTFFSASRCQIQVFYLSTDFKFDVIKLV